MIDSRCNVSLTHCTVTGEQLCGHAAEIIYLYALHGVILLMLYLHRLATGDLSIGSNFRLHVAKVQHQQQKSCSPKPRHEAWAWQMELGGTCGEAALDEHPLVALQPLLVLWRAFEAGGRAAGWVLGAGRSVCRLRPLRTQLHLGSLISCADHSVRCCLLDCDRISMPVCGCVAVSAFGCDSNAGSLIICTALEPAYSFC